MNDDDIAPRCDELAARVLAWCEARGLKIAAAESLTGGLLADAFVRIPGASNVFLGSAVTYDIRAKASVLGVDRGLLQSEGAVHPEYGDTVIGLSTTGVAGPGPDGDKPAGLVYIGLSLPAAARADGNPLLEARELRLDGDRARVRRLTVLRVLENVSQLTASFEE